MSKPEHDASTEPMEGHAFARLEEVVQEAVRRISLLRDDLREAQAQGERMQEILRGLTGGEEDPVALADRIQRLEVVNQDLLERLSRGRAGVERLLARIRFLEEQG